MKTEKHKWEKQKTCYYGLGDIDEHLIEEYLECSGCGARKPLGEVQGMMIERKTTEEILEIVDSFKINSEQYSNSQEEFIDKVWLSEESVKEFIEDIIDGCSKCDKQENTIDPYCIRCKIYEKFSFLGEKK